MLKKNKRKNYFALLVRDDELQLAQTDRKGRVVVAATQPLEEKIVERGRIVDKENFTAVLKSFLAAKKVNKKFVVVGLPEVAAFSRTISLPRLASEEMDDAVRWESEPLLPFPLKGAYLDWMKLAKREEGEEQSILVMALPVSLVDGYAEILESLGFHLVAFEPASLSLARLVPDSQTDQLIVDIGSKEAVLVLMGETGEISLSSTVAFSDQKKAEDVLGMVQNAVRFYQRRFGEKSKLTKIWLCGSGAGSELVTQIKEKTGLETVLLRGENPGFEVAISLAQKDVASPRDEMTINLIPPRIQSIYDLAQKSRRVANWLKVWLFGLFLSFFILGVMAAKIYFEANKIEGQIIEFRAAAQGIGGVATQAQDLQSRSNRVLSALSQQQNPAEVFTLVRQVSGREIEINHLVYDYLTGTLNVDGRAETRTSLVVFRENLEQTGRFSLVRVPLSSLEKERNAEFTITLVEK
ncbi:pilus assembly protein PilM [Patescibacteria group bacterium]|nr:pilus assembly protein PilM [Patescibacteria group bacterium]